jgi:hypothetical protein
VRSPSTFHQEIRQNTTEDLRSGVAVRIIARRAALAGDATDHAVALSGLFEDLEDHPHRPLVELRRIPLLEIFDWLPLVHPFQAMELPQFPGRFTTD